MKLEGPAVVGVPVIAPPALSKRPAVIGPLETVQVYPVPVPPDAASVCEYGAVTSPGVSGEMVVMLGAGVTVSVSGGLLADVGVLSVTVMTTVVEVTALEDRGPEMAPVVALNVSPEGKPDIDQVYGGEPPVALGDAA